MHDLACVPNSPSGLGSRSLLCRGRRGNALQLLSMNNCESLKLNTAAISEARHPTPCISAATHTNSSITQYVNIWDCRQLATCKTPYYLCSLCSLACRSLPSPGRTSSALHPPSSLSSLSPAAPSPATSWRCDCDYDHDFLNRGHPNHRSCEPAMLRRPAFSAFFSSGSSVLFRLRCPRGGSDS